MIYVFQKIVSVKEGKADTRDMLIYRGKLLYKHPLENDTRRKPGYINNQHRKFFFRRLVPKDRKFTFERKKKHQIIPYWVNGFIFGQNELKRI